MSAFTQMAVDKIITSKPCTLYSVILTASSAGVADVSVYEGQDTSSGQLIATVKVAASSTVQVRWEGLTCDRGLYVDVGSNVAALTVEWSPRGFGS